METEQYQLPKEFATKWVEALRSGNYMQTRGEFYNESKGEICYCASGLAYIANGFQFISKSLVEKDGAKYSPWGYYGYGFPGPIIQAELVDKIVELNDSQNMPFTKMADWIEANVEFI